MENYYLILVVVLFALAISDLIVGVSNDAVNFLNSALGSKAAPRWVIFLLASIGVLVGATFSNGMMEVARKGIFHPDMFVFSEIMVIFLAVMITDIILLDLFNTFGMPTSTTVSIVFELLGSAVAVSIVKIKSMGGMIAMDLPLYINSGKALAIITGILLSVLFAFTLGAIVQYITRFIFSFKYRKPMKYLGAFFGSLAITAITYFIFIKGMKGSSFADYQLSSGETLQEWFHQNTTLVLLYSFGFFVIFLQLLNWLFGVKILKLVVMIGTFALAMAFAGNDLVNFIGVPIAGYKSFQAWMESGGMAPGSFSMEMLSGKSQTPVFMLLMSGLIMVITLIFSKKARKVTETEINLARQSEGSERFGSSMAARAIVRGSTKINKRLLAIMPESMTEAVKNRFQSFSYYRDEDPNAPAFDKLRASVNLVMASILIAIGTSLKLPLSTTYVTFMVAMGTSLADRAWDRDTAVYRISGVFAVIGGWFLTAIIAFTASGIIAMTISYGGRFMVFVFVAVAAFMVIRTQFFFRKRAAMNASEEEDIVSETDTMNLIIEKSTRQVSKELTSTIQILTNSIENFLTENRHDLLLVEKDCEALNARVKKNKDKVFSVVNQLTDVSIDTGHYYVQMTDYNRELAHAVHFMLQPMVEYVDNNHKPFKPDQAEELTKLTGMVGAFLNNMLTAVQAENFDDLDNLVAEREQIFEWQKKIEKNQIKRIKKKITNSRNSQLFFKINSEIQNLLLHAVNVFKAQRDFIINTRAVGQEEEGVNDNQNPELNTDAGPDMPVEDV